MKSQHHKTLKLFTGLGSAIALGACLAVAPGCTEKEQAPAPEAKTEAAAPAKAMSPAAKAGKIANQITANPAQAEQILQNEGWSQAEFKSLLYEIALDPEKSAEYEAARQAN